jgi:putative hydrolase of the HAD superfamily
LTALFNRVNTLTFDFWNTLYSFDADMWEEVGPQRTKVLRDLLAGGGVSPSDEEVETVYRDGFHAYMAAWESGRHFGAVEEVAYFLDRFGLSPASLGAEVIDLAVRGVEEASRLGRLSLVEGVAETIPRLAEAGYKLGLISDTSLTPGRILKEFMAADDLLQYFSALTFSDETGFTKPDRRMFLRTLAALDAEPAGAAHVGDTPRTDIAGAKSLDMVAIRCAAVMDHPESPEADFVIRDHREIPAILQQLEATGGR